MGYTFEEMNKFFYPESIAIVGVPRGHNRFGGASFLARLMEGSFKGRLYPINPKADEIAGLKAYPGLSALPEAPDLVIICVAAKFVPSLLKECASIGSRHIHIFSSGFNEISTEEGDKLTREMTEISEAENLLVVGPNCMGFYCPTSGVTAWGAIPGMSGPVGIISQSGGITQRFTEYAFSLGLGVDKAVSMGNGLVLTSLDFLEFMAEDDNIRVIAMYVESVADGAGFLKLAREVNKKKPLVILKGGLSPAGADTVASHTGSMAGQQKIWQAFFQQSGCTQVHSVNEWVDATLAFALLGNPGGKGVFMIGGGGGNSVSNSDYFTDEGLDIPRLSPDIMKRLSDNVPEVGNIAGNPLDVWRVFEDPDYLGQVLTLGYEDPNVNMLVVDRLIPRLAFHTSDAPDPTSKIAAFINAAKNKKPTAINVDSEGGDRELATLGANMLAGFNQAGVAAYPTMERTARALNHLQKYHARKDYL